MKSPETTKTAPSTIWISGPQPAAGEEKEHDRSFLSEWVLRACRTPPARRIGARLELRRPGTGLTVVRVTYTQG